MNEVLSAIKTRRSVRSYKRAKVDRSVIEQILEAASWAPSGNNLQPWKFVVITNETTISELADLTVFGNWVRTAPCLIAVYYDRSRVDNSIFDAEMKHMQAIGAAIQNILLAAHSIGLGTCWIGEILKNQDKVNELLVIPQGLKLMAVITLGYPEKTSKSRRKPLDESILSWV
ncbi:MAG: nitroreductase family protein [Negativicutes bacterium]